MSIHRRAAKRDTTEKAIIAALRAFGFSVVQLSVPDGPDLLVGKCGLSRAIEVKTGKAGLRPGQQDWWADWRGNKAIVLRSVDDVPFLVRAWEYPDGQLRDVLINSREYTT